MAPITFVILFIVLFFSSSYPSSHHEPKEWGITFSQKMAENLNLDWRQTYTATLADLHPDRLRLIAYWDKIEPQNGEYNFTDLDWQMTEAEKYNIPVTLTVGKKVPRWPECHVPPWAAGMNDNELQPFVHSYVTKVVERYKDSANLNLWQVENEPFIRFGDCPTLSKQWLKEEIALVRRLDPTHKILVTDGGAWGSWYTAAKTGDVFGTTLYTKVYRRGLGHTRPPFPAGYYRLKRDFMRWLTRKPNQEYLFTEIGLEPWGAKPIAAMTMNEQKKEHSLVEFRRTVRFAERTRYDVFYLWGAEWWYSMKLNGNPVYWNEAKQTMNNDVTIPSDFLWGAATSSHQVEGNTANDWTEWEKSNADRLAQGASKKLPEASPIWPEIQNQATDPNNYISGVASDQYNKFDDDFALAESLGMNAQRISLEWSRIEPQKGVFDEVELDHYRQVITSLKNHGQEPFVTLWHYTSPEWFSEAGGWENPEAIKFFANYAQKVAESLGAGVRYWQTINEPGVYSALAYLSGQRPPEKHSPIIYWQVYNRLAEAHKQAYTVMKAADTDAQIGIAQDAASFHAAKPWPHLIAAQKLATWYNNRFFLDRIKDYQDFIGINYYFDYPLGRNPDRNRSDIGWGLHPSGLRQVVKNVAQYHKPIYITENGLADRNDRYRGDYIKEMVGVLRELRREGYDIRGYFHWSLIDNFEWDKGFWPRFGLIEVDYPTQKRTIRPSGFIYKQQIESARNQ